MDGPLPMSEAPQQCALCCNDDDSVSALQRCDGPCARWFCIESCAPELGVSYDKHLTAGDLVCRDCQELEAKKKKKKKKAAKLKKLEVNSVTTTTPRVLRASHSQR